MLSSPKLLPLIAVFFFASFAIQAEDTDIIQLKNSVRNKLANPEMKTLAINQGKERAVLCSQCHGVDGNSTKPGVPNLAAQNPLYLLNQIEKFSDGRRINYVMNALSKNFSLDDKENLAIYYASMTVKVTKSSNPQIKNGQVIYANKCSACHGAKGIGQAEFARLAGQQIVYVESTLKTFRDNANNRATSSKRNSVFMESVTQNLTDKDIAALAAYVAQLD